MTLERAIALAALAHEGQLDKAGQPYILHPLRVMLRVTTGDERLAAVLHDVVEDCGISLEELGHRGVPARVVEAVDALTRRSDETYEAYVRRAASNSIANSVKLADLEDNSDLSRLPEPTEADLARTERYRRAIGLLRASR